MLDTEKLGVLAIIHSEGSEPSAFSLTRISDGKSLSKVTISSPYEYGIEGRAQSNLMRELRWYLEQFLQYPFHPETVRAGHVLDALKSWGSQAFNALFDRRGASEWLSRSGILQVRSDDPQVLSWPWEALFDPRAGTYLAHRYRIERRLDELEDPPKLGPLPTDRINLLMVVSRPYERDIRYRSLARPLLELIQSRHLSVHLDILRPPTFNQLRQHLRVHPHFYHVIHFDGHGAYGVGGGHPQPYQFQAPQGCLVFENEKGEPDPKSSGDLSTLLREHAVPVVVLNACRSATLDERAEDAFASVATALLRGGMRSVVAMAYSLYVSGAQVFLPAFYQRLFETGSVAEAALAGRQQMLADKERLSARGPFELHDWLLPVLYQQAPLDLTYGKQVKSEKFESRLPEEVLDKREAYGFIGRDGPILDLERALHREAPCILIQGLGGVGKTTLARGFLRWLDETGGLDGALWLGFSNIHSTEHVVNQIGQVFYGFNFGIAPNKVELIVRALDRRRFIIVWDNFESAAHNIPLPDRADLGRFDQLSRFLDAIRSTRSKVIVTSRSSEEWLTASQRCVVRLGGLDGEERWEYCDKILQELGLSSKVKRDDPELDNLMKQLGGHPLAMRAVLPRLEQMSATEVRNALKNNISDLGLNENEEQGRLFATLRFVEGALPEDLRPLLPLIGLHESYLETVFTAGMAQQVDPTWTPARINQLMAALGEAGLVREILKSTYEMHPLLTSYIRSRGGASEGCQRAFVTLMAVIADELAQRELHEQRTLFFLYSANFHNALDLSAKLKMDEPFAALTQFLALRAQGTRDFVEASRLGYQLSQHGAATAQYDVQAAAYHLLGRIAEERRDFDTARDWYLKSLAIKIKEGDDQGTVASYHQLGRIAEEQFDFDTAQDWYLKSLALAERLGIEKFGAKIYNQLGSIAENHRELETARQWYLKSLAISERCGNESGVAAAYFQLGRLAETQGNSSTAHEWYLKSLAISERRGIEDTAAAACHALGCIAATQKDVDAAREWYLKSLAIEERLADENGAAATYHQLGSLAKQQGDFAAAREWYLKSLSIKVRLRNEHGAALTYRELAKLAEEQGDSAAAQGWWLKSLPATERQRNDQALVITYDGLANVAQKQKEYATAREWHLKALAVKERQGNEHGSAITCSQIGAIAWLQNDAEESARWLTRSIRSFTKAGDQYLATTVTRSLLVFFWRASDEDKQRIRTYWDEASLGPFPSDTREGNLSITLGDDDEGSVYDQLGFVAAEQKDFAVAREWHLKSLAIKERLGDQRGVAAIYHRLGSIAKEQGDFTTAREWYLKSLAIKERLGDQHGMAGTYYQLGKLAQERVDFASAQEWYLKSLAIEERQGDKHGAAITFRELGTIAKEQRDFATAREWFLKSLAIEEQQADEHGSAVICSQMGAIAWLQNNAEESARWLTRSIRSFTKAGDQYLATTVTRSLLVFFWKASDKDKQKIETKWNEANLGPFPTDTREGNLSIALRDDDDVSVFEQLGFIAAEQKDFVAAREWYLKSLAIKERLGDQRGVAATSHRVGNIAKEQRDFSAARECYLKALAIEERLGDEHGSAATYHQLGKLAQEQGDFAPAQEWYLKSLASSERQGNEHGSAINCSQMGAIAWLQNNAEESARWLIRSIRSFTKAGDQNAAATVTRSLLVLFWEASDEDKQEIETSWNEASLGAFPTDTRDGRLSITQQDDVGAYDQLGFIAAEQKDFAAAREWYLKSLAIKERLGDEHGTAATYQQLGKLAQEQGEFGPAQEWYLKSLASTERQGNEHGSAIICSQIGIVAWLQGNADESAKWLIRSIHSFAKAGDQRSAEIAIGGVLEFYCEASDDDKQKIKTKWNEANLGPFPSDTREGTPP